VSRLALLWLLGDLGVLLLPAIPAPPLAWVLAAAALASLAFRWGRAVAGFTLGCAWCLLLLSGYETTRLDAADEERRLLDCLIRTLPTVAGADARFDARCTPAQGGEAPRNLRIYWPDAAPVRVGESWRLLLDLHAPRRRENPGSGDGVTALRRERIHGIGRVLGSPLNVRLAAGRWSIDRLRERIVADIARVTPERDAAALIAALAVGDTRRVSEEQWRVFNATGITHLVAISGLHVTFFGLVVAALARRAWGRCRLCVRRLPRENTALLAGFAAASAYAFLAGFSVPTQRTLIMLAAWCLTRLLLRAAGAAPPLAVALVGVLLLDPFAPLAAGFWLSFGAVAALMAAATDAAGRGLPAQLAALWRAQWVVAVALVPVMLAVFGSLSWAGLVVNFIAIPLFSFILIPLILAGVALGALSDALSHVCFGVAARIIHACFPALQAIADLDGSIWQRTPPLWWFVLAILALVVALLPWSPRLRLSSVLVLLPLAWPVSPEPAYGELRVMLLDTGRTPAVIVRTARHALLYDLGESYGSGGRVVRRTVLPALRAQGVERLDRVMLPRLSHERGIGLVALLASIPVDVLQTGAIGALPPEFQACRGGDAWDWDGVRFEQLAREECTLRIVTDQSAILLMGSLDAGVQRELVAQGLPHTPIVLLPRHGAASAYEPLLQAATRPDLVLLANTMAGARAAGVGRTLAHWRAGGAGLRISGVEGAIELRMGAPPGIMPRPLERETDRRCGKSCVPADR
jgi:competence protein ComEC